MARNLKLSADFYISNFLYHVATICSNPFYLSQKTPEIACTTTQTANSSINFLPKQT